MNPPRQLVLLCDGTNNNLSGRHSDTHVVLLAELLRLYPDANRLLYYDPGVGNPGQLPGTTVADKLRRVRDRIDGLAFGRGLFDNIAEGYRFLMANWRPGDQIFVFGFSRGAFTARSIAGLVNAFGIIDSHQDTLVSSLIATYFSSPSPERKAIAAQAARLFGQGGTPQQWPVVHFVGVWDTVASVGLPPFGLKITAKPDLTGKHFRYVRHALALDEQRAQFLPRAYEQSDGAYRMANGGEGNVKQCWFRGSHCDVGGGNHYPYSELSRAPFAWLVAEAIDCGLSLPANAEHPALLGEAAVIDLMPRLDPDPPDRKAARINSETCTTPLWALTGLKVRDTVHALVDGEAAGTGSTVKMAVHPSVDQWSHAFPTRTAWCERGSASSWGAAAALMALLVLLMAAMGWQLLSPDGALPPLAQLDAAFHANLRLQAWQLSLPLAVDWASQGLALERPVNALLLDLLLIAGYAVVLAPWVCRAFARHAGLIRVGDATPTWLNRAGWALPLAVGADLLENLLTGLTLLALGADFQVIAWPLRPLLAAASLAKCTGLLGVATLITTSFLIHHREPALRPAAG